MAPTDKLRHATYQQSYGYRANLPTTPQLTAYLLRLMTTKRTNLCLSADVQTTSQLLDLAEECGDSICVLKTHADIISDFGERTINGLVEIATRKKFLLFEDRKFGDIGNTVQTQYAAGTHRIATWSPITNAHIFPGPAIIDALRSAAYSALAASNSRFSTEISGGGPVSEDLDHFLSQHKRRSRASARSGRSQQANDITNIESEDEEDDNKTARSFSPEEDSWPAEGWPRDPHAVTARLARKGSIVSVSTTISSSAEYISPPPTGTASRFGSGISLPLSASSEMTSGPPIARGLLLLAQMSSKDNLFTGEYTRKCVEMAQENRDFVLGFIAQEALNKAPEDNFITMTPGISLPPSSSRPPSVRSISSRSLTKAAPTPPSPRGTTFTISPAPNAANHKGDSLGQQYNTPRSAIIEKGVDIIIVGRGILDKTDRASEAERYRREGWTAYQERVGAETGGRRLVSNSTGNIRNSIDSKRSGF